MNGSLTISQWEAMRVPIAYRSVSLEAIRGLPHESAVLKILDTLPKSLRAGHGAGFYGKYSSGKSALAALVLRVALERLSVCGVWIKSRELVSMNIEGWLDLDGEPLWDRVLSSRLLVLDELWFSSGGARRTDTIQEEVLRFRVENRLSTFITTNIDPEELQTSAKSFYAVSTETILWVKICGYDFRADPKKRLGGS